MSSTNYLTNKENTLCFKKFNKFKALLDVDQKMAQLLSPTLLSKDQGIGLGLLEL